MTISLSGLPNGVTASPLVLAADSTDGTITLSVGEQAAEGPVSLGVSGDGATGELTLNVGPGAGALDATFGQNGAASPPPAALGVAGYATALVLQPDGKIVVAARPYKDLDDEVPQSAVIRFTETGALDTAFGRSDVRNGGRHPPGLDSQCLGDRSRRPRGHLGNQRRIGRRGSI